MQLLLSALVRGRPAAFLLALPPPLFPRPPDGGPGQAFWALCLGPPSEVAPDAVELCSTAGPPGCFQAAARTLWGSTANIAQGTQPSLPNSSSKQSQGSRQYSGPYEHQKWCTPGFDLPRPVMRRSLRPRDERVPRVPGPDALRALPPVRPHGCLRRLFPQPSRPARGCTGMQDMGMAGFGRWLGPSFHLQGCNPPHL